MDPSTSLSNFQDQIQHKNQVMIVKMEIEIRGGKCDVAISVFLQLQTLFTAN